MYVKEENITTCYCGVLVVYPFGCDAPFVKKRNGVLIQRRQYFRGTR